MVKSWFALSSCQWTLILELFSALRLTPGVDFVHTEQSAAQRSDYYLRRAKKATSHFCTRLLAAALDVSPENKTVLDRATELGCSLPGPSSGGPSLPIGPIRSWGHSGPPAADCLDQPGSRTQDIFPTPLGFIHVSQLDLPDWKNTLKYLRDASVKRFNKIAKKHKAAPFVETNQEFFNSQITDVRNALHEKDAWPQVYGSAEYMEWANAARKICLSFARKLDIPLSEEEAEEMDVGLWAAVYPKARKGELVTHNFHTHQEAFVSFALYVSMPEPTTPLVLADPRGMPPLEVNHVSVEDVSVDGEPPFHRPVEFYAGEGDIIVFPSYQVHKVPPHIGKGNRVVWPGNCFLPGQPTAERLVLPLDHWQRFALTRGSAPALPGMKDRRPGAVKAYQAHAESALDEAYYHHDDPATKLWEVQNQLVAMLQFAAHDAQVWLDAGNISAHVSVLMTALGKRNRDFFTDTTAFWHRALQLDPTSKSSVKSFIKKLTPKAGDDDALRRAYAEAKGLPKLIKGWKSLGEPEFIQFLHSDINGPQKCQRMCPASAPAPFRALVTTGAFSTRVFVAPLMAGEAEDQSILAFAKHASGNVSGAVVFGDRPPCWWRDESATFAGAVCDKNATIWFADPRGAWPTGSTPASPGVWPPDCSAMLGTEPKAPFHRHVALECSAGEFMLFPGWLAYQPAPDSKASVRSFIIKVPISATAVAGWTLPVLHPNCAKQKKAKRAKRSRSEL